MEYDFEKLKKKRMLTVKEAEFYLGYKKSKIYQLLDSGEIEGTRDTAVRLFRESLDRYQKRYLTTG